MKNQMLILALAAVLLGCKEEGVKPLPENWQGKWQGPEATFLALEEREGGVKVTIQNLDGPRVFEGNVERNGVTFTRDGVEETIHAGSGKDTGMKWLADKDNCLVVKSGEGYCR